MTWQVPTVRAGDPGARPAARAQSRHARRGAAPTHRRLLVLPPLCFHRSNPQGLATRSRSSAPWSSCLLTPLPTSDCGFSPPSSHVKVLPLGGGDASAGGNGPALRAAHLWHPLAALELCGRAGRALPAPARGVRHVSRPSKLGRCPSLYRVPTGSMPSLTADRTLESLARDRTRTSSTRVLS